MMSCFLRGRGGGRGLFWPLRTTDPHEEEEEKEEEGDCESEKDANKGTGEEQEGEGEQEEGKSFSSDKRASMFSLVMKATSSSSSDRRVSHVLRSVTLKQLRNCCTLFVVSPLGFDEDEEHEDEEDWAVDESEMRGSFSASDGSGGKRERREDASERNPKQRRMSMASETS